MLTVVMASDEASPFLKEYEVLFQPFIQDGRIAFCRWNPQGRDLRSALPELRSTVRGHERWRALVVLPLPTAGGEPGQEEYPARSDNPFDFLSNADPQAGRAVCESDVPLIRLAQMLGGVPEPVYDYTDSIVEGEQGEYRDTILTTPLKELEEQRRAWAQLEEKYHFPCDKPAEVWLLAARRVDPMRGRKKLPADVAVPGPAPERGFAVRNRYPARARFLVMDCAMPDHARCREDEFTFWMMVLTLALNQYEGGRLEPENLYRLQGAVDTQIMQGLFSNYCNRLMRIDRDVSRRQALLRLRLEDSREQEELPDYSLKIPVEYTADVPAGLTVDQIPVGLARDCPIQEKHWWNTKMVESRHAFRRLLNAPARALDMACALLRRNDRIDVATLSRMDRYQLRELDMQLNDEEIEIFCADSAAALPLRRFEQTRDQAERAVRTNISRRMKRATAIGAGATGLGAFALGFVPELMRVSALPGGTKEMLLAGAIRLGVLAVVGVLALLFFRRGLVRLIRDYNGEMRKIEMKVALSCHFFEGYLSRVCAYMRGRSIVDVLRSKEMRMQEGIYQMEKHHAAIARCCERTRGWMRDFGLDVLPDDQQGRAEYFNAAIDPEENEAYDLRTEHSGSIRDSQGKRILVPYPFVSEMEIKREETAQ